MIFYTQKKKIALLTVICLVVSLAFYSFKDAQPQPRKLKNLKVFPADATYEQVDHAMDQFKVDLGVRCNYCHTPSKENPKRMDMASDENPKKEITRQMMRMTEEMNRKYISTIPHADTVQVQTITCNTCHRGVPKPFGKPSVLPNSPQRVQPASNNPTPPTPPTHK